MNKLRCKELERLAQEDALNAVYNSVPADIAETIINTTVNALSLTESSPVEKEQMQEECVSMMKTRKVIAPETDEEKRFYSDMLQKETLKIAGEAVTAIHRSMNIIFSIDSTAAGELVKWQGGAFGLCDCILLPNILDYIKQHDANGLREALEAERTKRRKAEKDLKTRRKHKHGSGKVKQAYTIFQNLRGRNTPSLRQFQNWLAGKNVPEGFPGIANLAKFSRWVDNWDGPEKRQAGSAIGGMSAEEIYGKRRK